MSEMISEMLSGTGIPFRRARFPAPPAGSYIVYTDDVSTDGPDGIPALRTHALTLEIYEAAPDDAAEATVETALAARGLQWDKQDRYWLQDEQRYQVIYEFTIYEKVRTR